jgi:hypothetical protein
MSDHNRPLSPQNPAVRTSVAQFLESKRAKIDAKDARLIFAVDATGSRQPSWDRTAKLQSEMFLEASGAGKIDVQLVYFRGWDECRASAWVRDSATMLRLMGRIHCQTGETQIGKVLAHALAERAKGRVDALVYIGDAMEENAAELFDAAKELGKQKIPAFMFLEGADQEAKAVFEEIARMTGGAFARFDSSSTGRLAELLKAAALFATGGLAALEAAKGSSNVLLLEQLRKPKP